jgi:hypothetical protein
MGSVSDSGGGSVARSALSEAPRESAASCVAGGLSKPNHNDGGALPGDWFAHYLALSCAITPFASNYTLFTGSVICDSSEFRYAKLRIHYGVNYLELGKSKPCSLIAPV